MTYVKPAELDKSYIGKRLHIDFGQRSFWFDWIKPGRPLDTVIIGVNGKRIKFIEHRVDDGFNNWFSEQYLESVEETDGLKVRITEFELLQINKKDISVKAFFAFIDKDEKVAPDKSFTKDLSFEKKDIIEFLFFRKSNN
jgi:hypothetical protein